MSQLDRLTQHRDAILLAEIGAWLHMLGKYDWQFIESHCGGRTSYDYQNQNFILSFKTQYPQLFDLLYYSAETKVDISSDKYQTALSTLPITSPSSVGIFIRDHRRTKEAREDKLKDQLTILLVDGHGRGSNIEKSEVQSNFPDQTLPLVYLSTAFGFTQQLTTTYYNTITLYQALNTLLQQLSISTDKDKWVVFNAQVRQEIFEHFQSALAETRLPFNDVTLLDQTASTVAFFKSALAERVVAGCWKPLMCESTTQYKWRTLTIPFAGLEYLQGVSGIADLLGRQNILTEAQDGVQTLLESTYPVGQEIYRDEQTSVFLVPDEANLLQWQNSAGQNLTLLIKQEISQATNGDIFPELQHSLMPQSTRTLYTIGQQIIKASSIDDMTSDVGPLTQAWQGVTDQQICANCGLRPQGSSNRTSSRKLCDICLKRREQRSKKWATSDLDRTIWLDEVADNNGRLALLVGSWDLAEWLNGTLVNTIIAASSLDFTQLEQDCRASLQTTRKGNPQRFQGLLAKLLKNDVREQFNYQFRPYFEAIIQPEWQDQATSGLAEETVAAMHFVRQNPSFARLRRIWQTTHQFWQDVCPTDPDRDIQQSLVGQTINAQPTRLQIIGVLTPQGTEKTLSLYHTYDLKLTNNVKLSVVWDSERKLFITCDNLDYLAKPELLGAPVRGFLKGELTLEEPTGYGGQNKTWGKITVEQVSKMEGSAYIPAIPILAEPRTFMALVPADKALEIVQAIQARYEVEMGKVRNRLPLHLGIVYFQRRTPLRAALDAGRRMLKYEAGSAKDDVWEVKRVEPNGKLPDGKKHLAAGTQQFAKTVIVELRQNGRSLTWYVPSVMGDGETPDCWYPYVFLNSDTEPIDRNRRFQAPNPWDKDDEDKPKPGWLVHASQLKAGDQVYFTPATLDFQWLDSAANRFEIAYENGCRRNRPVRPYLLDDMDTISKAWDLVAGPDGLTSSQIYALRDLVAAKREVWQPTSDQYEQGGTFWQFCHNAVVNANWNKTPGKSVLDKLTDWAVSGLLADVIQLYMGIMKQKPQREDKNNE